MLCILLILFSFCYKYELYILNHAHSTQISSQFKLVLPTHESPNYNITAFQLFNDHNISLQQLTDAFQTAENFHKLWIRNEKNYEDEDYYNDEVPKKSSFSIADKFDYNNQRNMLMTNQAKLQGISHPWQFPQNLESSSKSQLSDNSMLLGHSSLKDAKLNSTKRSKKQTDNQQKQHQTQQKLQQNLQQNLQPQQNKQQHFQEPHGQQMMKIRPFTTTLVKPQFALI